jgi:hypothetical protein
LLDERNIVTAAVEFRDRAVPEMDFPGRISAAPPRVSGKEPPLALAALFGGAVMLDASGNARSSDTSHVRRFPSKRGELAGFPRLAPLTALLLPHRGFGVVC